MITSRDAFIQNVRQAVAEGNRPGSSAPLPSRGSLGYQGAGADPLGRFIAELTAVGGFPSLVPDDAAAIARLGALVQERSAKKVMLGRSPCLDRLGLANYLSGCGVEVLSVDAFTAESCKVPFFAADIAISGVDFLVAETGTMVMLSAPTAPRSGSLLPPIHIAVADRSQILPDLFDLFGKLPPEQGMPSCVSLITGPSKTGDIELKLVTGVHGPGEIHVIVIDGAPDRT